MKNRQQNVETFFERTFNLSYLILHALYLNIEKTFTFKNLIDYLVCLYKPKHKH